MADSEKVINGLEHCSSHERDSDKFGGIGKCSGCPYYGYDCVDRLKNDLLALIKEQKADIDALKNAYKDLTEKGEVIVRCKYCKHGHPYKFENGKSCIVCHRCFVKDADTIQFVNYLPENWYCAGGVKKDD